MSGIREKLEDARNQMLLEIIWPVHKPGKEEKREETITLRERIFSWIMDEKFGNMHRSRSHVANAIAETLHCPEPPNRVPEADLSNVIDYCSAKRRLRP